MMKKILTLSLFLLCAAGVFAQSNKINWVTFEQGMELWSVDHKPLMIDMYTDWCVWCKRMDANTFTDTAVIRYVNEHFHAVKFNAETTEPIKYQDSVYQNLNFLSASSGMPSRQKSHSLAEKLLSGRMSYPTLVFMVPTINFIAPVPGYRSPETLEPLLLYFGEEIYSINNTFEAFSKGLEVNRIIKK